MTKDNWIKAFDKLDYELGRLQAQAIMGEGRSRGGAINTIKRIKTLFKRVEKDAIEKTNKRWRDKLKEYIDKLDKWTPPSQFGSASGSMTKKFIKDDLSDLLEDKK